jgi:hypothetical protein
MPFSFHADESTKILHIQADGEVDDAELMELRARLGHEAAFIAGYPILCDCSTLASVSISASLIELLARTARSRTNLVAIIAPTAVVFGLARMYQILSDPEDKRIQVFSKSGEAMAWLETHTEALLK